MRLCGSISRRSEVNLLERATMLQEELPVEPAAEIAHRAYQAPTVVESREQTQETADTRALSDWTAKLRRRSRRAQTQVVSITVGSLACLLLSIPIRNLIGPDAAYNVAIASSILSLALFTAQKRQIWPFGPLPAQKAEAAPDLSSVDTGTLLDLMPQLNSLFEPILLELTNRLPRMQPEEFMQLNLQHRFKLYLMLGSDSTAPGPNPVVEQFLLTFVKSLAQIGDAVALQRIKRLADAPARSRFQQELKAAAQEALPALKLRVSGMNADRTLLRGSSPNSTSPAVLMRPAAAPPQTDAQDLLHPTDTPGSPPTGM